MIDKNIGKTFNRLTILEIDNDKIVEQKKLLKHLLILKDKNLLKS